MDGKEHGTGQDPATPEAPADARPREEKLRARRAALLVKATVAGKATQAYFEKALKAHEIDTLNLLKDT